MVVRNLTAAIMTMCVFAGSALAWSPSDSVTVDEILLMDTAPAGVVFEVASPDDDALAWALPGIRGHVRDLRELFPALRMVVVTHGLESLSLMKQYSDDYPKVHAEAIALTGTDKVPMYVGGKYAWVHGVEPEQFAGFVEVAESGPQKIKTFKDEDYLVVEMRKQEPGAEEF